MVLFSISILAIYFGEWIAKYSLSDDAFWYYSSCSKQLMLAICITFAFNLVKDIKAKSVFAFLCFSMWCDFVLDLAWAFYGVEFRSLAPAAIIFAAWFFFVLYRKYDIESDEIDESKVMLLMLRPDSFFMYLKSLFGVPVSSICILANGFVYSFRTDSKKFTRTKYTDRWLLRHVCINTGVDITNGVKSSLMRTVGLKRGIGIKCVYALRNTLKEMGVAWEPKTFLHNIPGLYAMQVIGNKK